ncbi:hypothetical protein KR018_009621 [Drosophila ironensis]|nr:hypothetical protein KR018_009621 [Drosophila ironensis]
MQNDKWPPPMGFSSAPPQPGQPQQGYPAQYDGPPEVNPAQNYQGPPAPPPIPPHEPPIRVQPPRQGCFAPEKNSPQRSAVMSAGPIFISGGLNIGWCIGFQGPIYYHTTKHNLIAWFIGAIIGALVSCLLANKVAKKYVLQFASLLVTIGGLVIACTKNNASATVAGCYLDGIANGLVFAPFLALAGEVTVPYIRGQISVRLEQIYFTSGILLQILYTSNWSNGSINPNEFTAENVKGIVSVVAGIMALGLGTFMIIESPVLLLVNNDEQGALDALRRLQKPSVLTEESYEQLAEHKRYLAANKDMSVGQSIGQAMPTFLRLAFLRALSAMSISSYVAYTFAYSVYLSYTVQDARAWFAGFAFCRWLGCCIPAYTIDRIGRKSTLLVGLLGSCGLAFAVGRQYDWTQAFHGVAVLVLVFEVFAGMAFTPTSAYLSEAYPLQVKQHFIAFTFIVEVLVFLIIRVIDFNVYFGGSRYFYAVGGMYLFGFIMGCVSLPETRLKTLRGAQEQFKSFLNLRFN